LIDFDGRSAMLSKLSTLAPRVYRSPHRELSKENAILADHRVVDLSPAVWTRSIDARLNHHARRLGMTSVASTEEAAAASRPGSASTIERCIVTPFLVPGRSAVSRSAPGKSSASDPKPAPHS